MISARLPGNPGLALLTAAAALVLLAPAEAATGRPPSGRLHPALREALLRQGPGARSPFARADRPGWALVKVRTSDPEGLAAEAAALGAKVRAIVGGVASIETPIAALERLADLPGTI